ncbi:phage tail protein [Pseudomonas sp. p1(2021b)]|uniref:phage tail protein n=1 Tax=Pseudomonas sp. p1(2021b) TaxID=2874628 RepID=UPI001CCDC639|nr:phage tail protein [Pseudomonas sp. p1(2021b)]UBM23292.1 phage tail protein [Pseudomonas sp. p1(2021b)]
MAIETFRWPTERGETPDIRYRVREARFGDGFRQTVGDGPNNKEDSYPITVTGRRARIHQVMDFLDRHSGSKAFLWTTPLGDLGLFTCVDPKPTPLGGDQFRVTATFQRAFHP